MRTHQGLPYIFIHPLPDFAIFSMEYFILSKVCTAEGGINSYTKVCQPVLDIIHSLKLVDYLLLQADKPWYYYYVFFPGKEKKLMKMTKNSTVFEPCISPSKLISIVTVV